MDRALAIGQIIDIEEEYTIADGLAGNIELGAITFPIIQRLVNGILLVNEEAIRSAIARVANEDHLIIEGAAAVSVAALEDARLEGHKVVAILTGRNIALELFTEAVAKGGL
jgi:threonine dehydratase